jgi:hypothetical protein
MWKVATSKRNNTKVLKDEMEAYVMGFQTVRYQNCFHRDHQNVKFLQAFPWFHETVRVPNTLTAEYGGGDKNSFITLSIVQIQT